MHQLLRLAFLLVLSLRSWGQVQSTPKLVTDQEHPHFGSIVLGYMGTSAEESWQADLLDELDGASFLRVYTQAPKLTTEETSDFPPVMGSYTFKADHVYFKARFPLLTGRSYWVWYKHYGASNGPGKVVEVKIPVNRSIKSPEVVAIYPSGSIWPANQLKFYIYFDQSMRTGFSVQALWLQDEQGEIVKDPFLDMGEELWDLDQKRLTVWFDPGRIKSLLIPNLEKGPPLNPNSSYKLIISRDWLAANGRSLKEDYVKEFQTGSKDITLPRPNEWDLTIPKPNSLDPVSIHFPEAMDMAMLHSGIGLLNQNHEVVVGEIGVEKQEKTWHWYPRNPWLPGEYILRISTDLEDLAGNNLQRLFDEPIGELDEIDRGQRYVDLIINIGFP